MNMVERLWFGNDDHPLFVAAFRAILQAVAAGGINFFTAWQFTDETKALVSAAIVPMLVIIGSRVGLEGVGDWRRYGSQRQH